MRRSVITLCLESATRTIVNRQQAHAGRRRVRRRHLPGRSGPPRGVPDREREEAGQAAAQHAYLRDDMAPLLAGLGFACRIHDNPAGADLPILVARRIEDPALPTVLLYGHGDVVRGNAARWDAGRDPWTLRVEGDRWYGRGTADNKGQHSINLAALRQAARARGRLGFNAVWLIETGEEAGSPGLAAFARPGAMSWRPMSSWPATARACTPSGPRCSRLARRGEFRAVAARARTRLPLGQLGRAAVQPRHRAGARHRHAGGRARSHHRARPASAAHPAGGGASPGRAGRGGGADDPAIDAHWASPACRPRKGVRLEQPGRADLRRRRSGQAGQRHPARGLCVVPAALRGRHGLARAGNPCARTPAPGRFRRGRHPPGRAGRRHPAVPGQRLGPLGRGLDRAQHRQAARAAAQPGRLAAQRHLRRPAGPAHDLCPTRTRPARSTRPTSTCWAASPRGLAIMAGLFWDLGDQGPALRDAAAPLRP